MPPPESPPAKPFASLLVPQQRRRPRPQRQRRADIAEARVSAAQPSTAAASVPGRNTHSARMTKRTTRPGRGRARRRRQQPATSPSSAELHQPGARGSARRVRADGLQHHRVAHPPPLPRRHRARQHQRPGQQRDATPSPAAPCRRATSRLATPSSASRTRMPETLGKASVSARSTAGLAPRSPRTVAIWVCGAASSRPGEATRAKLMPRPRHSISPQVGDASGRCRGPAR